MGRDFRWRDAFGFLEFLCFVFTFDGRDWGWDIWVGAVGSQWGKLIFIPKTISHGLGV